MNHYVIRIKVNPKAVVGYEKLQAVAKNLKAKLILTLDISFKQTHAGMRFPDTIIISESYKGGSLDAAGLNGWERNRTEYSYQNYRFFEVGVQVTQKTE